ncbi:hypothetical protein R1sor_023354 [Riccia sorocarpa]|uniref:F-box domain-containing protein n=1 Tax=Riccia sorocarpa TaxID=122646 RepID=A0ABD3GMI8_9MARC
MAYSRRRDDSVGVQVDFEESSSNSSGPGNAAEGPWTNLLDEALGEVFSRLPFEERLRTVPLVCKNWRRASYDPQCWRKVDMNSWFQKRTEEDYWFEFECESKIDFFIKQVVDRSCGQLSELRTMHCSDASIEYIADRCPSLRVLAIPNSLAVTDKSATKLAANCPLLQTLDVSDCYNISNQALEAFGRNCPRLHWLGRNMVKKQDLGAAAPVPDGDEEAIVVSRHMGRLKHLEMKKTSLSDFGLAYLARGCNQLESLNLACCTALSPKALEDVSKQCTNLKEFTKPITPRMHVNPEFLWVFFE